MVRPPLARALSRLGVTSRSQAATLIRSGRVRVNGRIVRDTAFTIQESGAEIDVDGMPCRPPAWRAILFHKPRGVVTTASDPQGRPTVFSVLGDAGTGLRAVGRLDLASTGLLILTNDTHLADWLTDPEQAIARLYVVTVRGRLAESAIERLTRGLSDAGGSLRASTATIVKASNRETHLTIELRQGRNREIRRMLAAVGHEVTRLKRVSFGGLELGSLPPGGWRELRPEDFVVAFGSGVPLSRQSRRPSR